MEIKPVYDAQPPEYPRKEDMTPEKLEASPPQRWVNNAAVTIALGALAAMSLAGCAPEPPLAGVPLPPEMTTEETAAWGTATPSATCEPYAGVPMPAETPIMTYMPAGDIAPPTLNVAPLFVHGDGQGAYGCVMVAPPVFLSEDEALSVVNDVAKDYGLEFLTHVSAELTNVLEPSVNIMQPENTLPSETYMTLRPDFMDATHGVAIEFVSVEDVKAWHRDTGVECSVERYDTIGAAAQLSDALDDAYTDTISTTGVLYDPCELSEKSEAQSQAMSLEQLKAQAKDFFEWLKSQGVI
jgi:hypothetical protein